MNKDIRILLVDDFATMRKLISRMLNNIGFYNIEEVDDGVPALEKVKEGNIDFVISDWIMPGMDGLSLVKAIKADEDIKHIPVLIITSQVDKADVVEILRSGAADFLGKPFNAKILEDKLQKILP